MKGLESRLDKEESKSLQGLQRGDKGSLGNAEQLSCMAGPGPEGGADAEA